MSCIAYPFKRLHALKAEVWYLVSFVKLKAVILLNKVLKSMEMESNFVLKT